MSIKVTTSNDVPPQYPRLVENKHTGALFLLTKEHKGTCIKSGSGNAGVGDFSESWTCDVVAYAGSVTLAQE